MKKYLFLVSVAALTMTSCSDQSTEFVGDKVAQQAREITFAPIAKPTTRISADTYQYAIDGTDFPDDLNMYVAAYQVEPTATNYFAGTQFVYDSSASTAASESRWSGSTKRYWPLTPAYINFLAYANVTGTAAFDGTTPASAATITQSSNSTAQTDLMYARGDGAVTQNATTGALTFPTKVDMAFKHAQAWMDFYVKAADAASANITLNSITLKGAKYAGTFTITHAAYDAKTGQGVSGAWTNVSTAAAENVAVPGWTAGTLSSSAFTHVGNGLLIVPDDDTATNDWTSFVINYTYDGHTYNYEYPAPAAPGATVAQATHYIFNITFTLHEILVKATVTDWDDATATGVSVGN